MRAAAAGALVALFVVACGPGTPSDVASTSRTTGSSSASSQSPVTMSTKLNCGDSHIGATSLAIYRFASALPFFVEIMDLSSPQRPYLACTLSPAWGARFLSATKLAFWNDNELGTADLASGAVTRTGLVAAQAATGAFSADSTKFAYRAYQDGGALTTHLYVNGSDRTLYAQAAMGGHGGPGPSLGPFDQLEFSPDGSLLLDYMLFRPPSGPANLMVFKADGSIAFQSAGAPGGTWSPTGSTLFFYASNQSGLAGELNRLDANGQRQVIASGLHGMNWPRMSPDGSAIIYNASDSSVPDCGGVPHVWRFDLVTGRPTQLSNLISSGPVFIDPNVIWSDEQQLGPCGPGGPTSPDGVILAHFLNGGLDTTVDMSPTVPPGGYQLFPSTYYVLDVWLASA